MIIKRIKEQWMVLVKEFEIGMRTKNKFVQINEKTAISLIKELLVVNYVI